MSNITAFFEGNLAADPTLRIVEVDGKDKAVSNFTIVVQDRVKNGDKWVDGDATFVKCIVWGKVAENVAESFGKGDRLTVAGDLRQETYEKDGDEYEQIVLSVRHVGASVFFNTVTVNRAKRSKKQTADEGQDEGE